MSTPRTNGTAHASARQANLDTARVVAEDNGVSLLRLVRRAIDDSGWKHAAVASVLRVKPPYLSLMLSGEKPWTAKHLAALPDEIEQRFAQSYAESFGHLVVEPLDGESAIKQLLAGLCGVLSEGRAAKKRMARMEPPR